MGKVWLSEKTGKEIDRGSASFSKAHNKRDFSIRKPLVLALTGFIVLFHFRKWYLLIPYTIFSLIVLALAKFLKTGDKNFLMARRVETA